MTGFLNLTIDNAPTIPNESAILFDITLVTKKVWECDQNGNYISGPNETYGPFSWANLGNGSYTWAGGTIQVVFENNNTIMKLPFDDGHILQTWTKN